MIVTQYFWPESFLINDLARTLRDQGHEITVATGKPNYPEGRIYDGYRAFTLDRETYAGDIAVHRVPLRARGSSGSIHLLLNYASFVCSGLLLFPFLLRSHRFDAILVFAGSPNVALPALPLRWIKRAHLAIWIQDLWPESLSATGHIRSRLILRAIGWLVRFTYWCADTVLVQSNAFVRPVSAYSAEDKIVYYPNSLRLPDASDVPSAQLPRDLVQILTMNFCVVFAGNLGSVQALETIVDAADRLRDLSAVRLVLVGSGSRSGWLEQSIRERRLENLLLPGRFPMSAMPELFNHAGCLLVTLKSEKILSYTVPSKVQAYLAAGKPIIAAIDGEGARIVREAGAGLTCAAEDADGLAACVRKLHALPGEQRRRMGEAGREYFLRHFEMASQAKRLIEIIEQRSKRHQPVMRTM